MEVTMIRKKIILGRQIKQKMWKVKYSVETFIDYVTLVTGIAVTTSKF
jgi:hypothetical protein